MVGCQAMLDGQCADDDGMQVADGQVGADRATLPAVQDYKHLEALPPRTPPTSPMLLPLYLPSPVTTARSMS
jgi:hypothetical protein